MKVKTIKQKHDVGIWLQITAELDSGKYVIEMRRDNAYDDGTLLTSTEARRISKALVLFADAVDRKNGNIES